MNQEFVGQELEVAAKRTLFHTLLTADKTGFLLLLTSKAKRIILTSVNKKNMHSYEQEEYITLHGHRESGLVETRSGVVMEWACKLKSKRSAPVQDQ